ncbi:MAG: hypothetical protein CBC64_005365 [Gammaproteobacteria bacterium TMED104]|nr:MAG: hypothetical protein CBC64_005365 [Gammaproteobacteria bacterium TMED104]|tara:strand:+ start:4394 stop:6550 length:2157 start_codon:yes stop_codon:yes gene_type:complete
MITTNILRLILVLFFVGQINASRLDYLFPYNNPSFSDYGTLGLIQMPNSRFLEEGSLGFVWSRNEPYMRGGIVAYPFNWFEIIYKYTDINDALYSNVKAYSGGQSLKDKGFDVKFRLLEESYYLPSISFGFRDFGGTNRFQSEYLVASKFINNFDFTLGVGWGVMSGGNFSYKNPLTDLADTFIERAANDGTGGTFSTNAWLSGRNIGLFGGVEWMLPNAKGHRIKLEFDSNNYDKDYLPLEGKRPIKADTNVNIGYTVPINNLLQLNFGITRGNTFQFGFSFTHNYGQRTPFFNKTDKPKRVKNAEIIKSLNSENKQYLYLTSLRDLQLEGIYLQYAKLEDETYTVRYSHSKYYNATTAIGRAARIIDQIAPDDVKTINLGEINGPFINFDAEIDRHSFNLNAKSQDYSTSFSTINFKSKKLDVNEYEFKPKAKFPFWSYSFGPALRSHIGGPDGFALGQLWLRGDGRIVFDRNNSITGSVGVGVYDNFDELKQKSNSILPHVRTEIVQYLKGTRDYNITRIQYDNIQKPSSNFYTRFSVGIFEEMFGGIGGEILYRPFNSNFGVGVDMYWVKQRDYDGMLDFIDYSVVTGHTTLYIQEPRTNVLVRLIGGRYLAKDSGVTLDVSRKFKSGLSMGIFASKTDISQEEFGEGSFDKGFYFNMPLEIFFQSYNKAVTGYGLRPITRDGAQRLITGYDLWGVTNSASFNTLNRTKDYIYD